jgi:hypothetical protein
VETPRLGGHEVLSHAQATEVAKRFNPTAGRMLWFSDDGSLLSGGETHRAVAQQRDEIYVCRRPPAGGAVEVARVSAEELEVNAEPAFGVPW